MKLNFVLAGFSLLILSLSRLSFSQHGFEYDTVLESSIFTFVESPEKINLPVKGKLHLFIFPSNNEPNEKEVGYFSCLANGCSADQIFISNIMLDSHVKPIKGLPQLVPANPEIFSPIEKHSNSCKLLLVDHEKKIKYFGTLESPKVFSTILKKNGLDLSYTPLSLSEILTMANISSDISDNQDKLISNITASSQTKLVVLYRSICMPCGEQTLLQNFIDLFLEYNLKNVQIFFMFRDSEATYYDNVYSVLSEQDLPIGAVNIKQPSPCLERHFLQGNPFLLLYSSEQRLVKTQVANGMSRKSLEKLLLAIENQAGWN